MDNTLKRAIKSACLTNNLQYRVGETIVMTLFKHLKETMAMSTNENPINFRIINLGLFYYKPKVKRIKDESTSTNL